jgi:protein SCO1/2
MQLEVVSRALDIANISPEKLTTLFITLDPERDTPEDMAIYTDNFHENITGLTGTVSQIQQAAKAYKVYFQKVADPETTGGYTVDHSSIVFLMGRDNTYWQHFTHRDSAEDIAGKITSIIEAAQN